jgi:hypothetical protein
MLIFMLHYSQGAEVLKISAIYAFSLGTKCPSRRIATVDATHDRAIAQIYIHLPYYMQSDLEELPREDVCALLTYKTARAKRDG